MEVCLSGLLGVAIGSSVSPCLSKCLLKYAFIFLFTWNWTFKSLSMQAAAGISECQDIPSFLWKLRPQVDTPGDAFPALRGLFPKVLSSS